MSDSSVLRPASRSETKDKSAAHQQRDLQTLSDRHTKMLKTIFTLFLLSLILSSAFSDLRAEGNPFICAGSYPQEIGDRTRAKVAGGARTPAEGSVNVLAIFAGFADERVKDARAPDYAEDLFDPELPGSFAHFYDAMSFGALKVWGASLPRWFFSAHPASHYLATNNTDQGEFGEFVLEILRKVDQDPYDADARSASERQTLFGPWIEKLRKDRSPEDRVGHQVDLIGFDNPLGRPGGPKSEVT